MSDMDITGKHLTIRASLAPRPSGDMFLLIGQKDPPLTTRLSGDTFLLIGPKGPPLKPRPFGDMFLTNLQELEESAR